MSTNEPSGIARIRRSIVFYVFLFFVACGVPTFLITTLIYRAELPIEDVESKQANFQDSISFEVPVYVNIPTAESVSLQYVEDTVNHAVRANFDVGNTWKFVLKDATSQSSQVSSLDLQQQYVVNLEAQSSEQNLFEVSPVSKHITLFSDEKALSGALAQHLTSALVDGVFHEELEAISAVLHGRKTAKSELVMPYSGAYNVVFNLFVENGKPVEWDIEQAIAKIEPVFESLSHYANFKISSQVQYYSKLRTKPVFDEEKHANVIKKSDLSTFINYGDWNLNNNDKYPSINFLIYFSESNYQKIPLQIEGSTTNSFLIPQWGGVQIYNKEKPILDGSVVKISDLDLDHILGVFVSQLFDLLGVPKYPKSPSIRIDSLHRVRALKNLKAALDNLSSLVQLTKTLNEIPIPEATKSHVVEALSLYDDAVQAIEDSNYISAIELSRRSFVSSDKAFFEKEMVQQAYFPSEHKLAVFLPLLGPICTIVLLCLIKALKDMKSSKKAAQVSSDVNEEAKKEI